MVSNNVQSNFRKIANIPKSQREAAKEEIISMLNGFKKGFDENRNNVFSDNERRISMIIIDNCKSFVEQVLK